MPLLIEKRIDIVGIGYKKVAMFQDVTYLKTREPPQSVKPFL